MIQINIKMPKSCWSCPCSHQALGDPYVKNFCGVKRKPINNIRDYHREEWCPLVEVKE